MKTRTIIALAGLSLLCLGLSVFHKTKYVWRKSAYDYVKLEKADESQGKMGQPAVIPTEQMKQILTSIKYTRPWLNLPGEAGKRTVREFDLLQLTEADKIASHLSDAFKQAKSDQWVDFSLELIRGQFVIGSDRLLDGLAFIKDGKLNFVFRNVVEVFPSEENQLNTSDPFKYYPGSSRLIAGQNQELGTNKKGKQAPNWIIVDLKAPEKPAAPAAEVEIGGTGQTSAPVQPAPAQPAAGQTASAQPAPPQPAAAQPAPSQPPASTKSVKERLIELRELYDQGMITEDEYNYKRKQILDQL